MARPKKIEEKNAQAKSIDEGKILSEIVEKVRDYETRMSRFYQDYNDWSDMFTIKKPNKSKGLNSFSNPRMSEMFRSANSLATTEYRMLTNKDPFFEFVGMDNVSRRNPQSVSMATEVIRTQLEKTNYKSSLLTALYMKNIFGTVVVEEPFDIIPISHLGRKLPVTGFEPKSMLQVAFDKYCTHIEKANWLSISDMVDVGWVRRQYEKEKGNGAWIKDNVDKAISDQAKNIEIDSYIRMRLAAAGYPADTWPNSVREVIRYYGKIECINDDVEYIVFVVNRQFIVKFAANPLQTGKRPFRVAHWFKWELEPLGYGLGKLFSHLHRQMDSNRQKIQDIITMASYSMMLKNRFAGINDKDMIIRPWGIVETDDMNAVKPLEPNLAALPHALSLESLLQEEFRAASGATNTLQAIITEATASEVSLAQNEAMRSISVKTEMAGEELVRSHIEMMHTNNMLYITEAFNISVDGEPKIVYPKDLLLDLDVKLKIVTDKDFKPERLKKMLEAYQVLTSIRNTNPDIFKWDMSELINSIVSALDVPQAKMYKGLTTERIGELQQLNSLMQQFRQSSAPAQMQEAAEGEGLPASTNLPGGAAIQSVPIGPTLGSPSVDSI